MNGTPGVDIRVRFAPSPTGSLHVGNALTAVANRHFADEHAGALVLRVDDTDPTRTVAGGEEAILDDLAWLGVEWDEGPVHQSERGALYAEAAERALASGAAERDETAPSASRETARPSCGPTGARRTSLRPSSTTSISGSRTSSAGRTTARTSSSSSGSPVRWAVSCPR